MMKKKKGLLNTIKRIRVRKKEKKYDKNNYKKISSNSKNYQNTKVDINRKSNDYVSNPSNISKNIIIDEKKVKEKKSKNVKKDIKKSNKKTNLVNFDHKLTDFEYKLKYLNLKDLDGSEFGRYFPPIRNKLVIIDSKDREFLVIRAGNNQITGDLLSFFKKNDLKPGNVLEIEYDPDMRSEKGLPIVKLKKKE